jgi:N-ethylmaleimide reductase
LKPEFASFDGGWHLTKAMNRLFTPFQSGSLTFRNRIVMAPMTRSRADAQGVVSSITADYYAQRASTGLIITEGVQPSAGGQGYARTPGIYTPAQIAAWKAVADAVHAAGGKIFMQLMHAGRIAHPANRTIDAQPVAPSAVRPETTKMWTDSLGMQEIGVPRALETAEIAGVIDEYRQATVNALAAGLDGVELHAASGYLPMQFLSTGTNQRTDQYGGSAENRIRFVVETLQAMIAAAGDSHKVGIKISPEMPFNDIHDAEPEATYTALAKALDPLGLAYVHIMRAGSETDYIALVRGLYHGNLIAGGRFDAEAGEKLLEAGGADAIAYGAPLIANPDLVERFRKGAPLAAPDASTFYTPGPKGYTDYPTL